MLIVCCSTADWNIINFNNNVNVRPIFIVYVVGPVVVVVANVMMMLMYNARHDRKGDGRAFGRIRSILSYNAKYLHNARHGDG